MSHYEQVIRQVRYYNRQPEHLTERRFHLTCSELNGRYTSNEFNVEVRHYTSLFTYFLGYVQSSLLLTYGTLYTIPNCKGLKQFM